MLPCSSAALGDDWGSRTKNKTTWRELAARQRLLVQLVLETDRRLAVVLAILMVVGGLLPVAFNLATGGLIGSIPQAIEGGMGSAAGKAMVTALALVAALFVIQEVAAPVRSLVSGHLGRKLNLSLRDRAMRAALAPIGVSHLEDPALLDKVNQAREIGPTGMTALSALNGLVALWTMRFSGTISAVIVMRYFPLVGLALVAFWLGVRISLRRDFLETIKLIVGQTERLRRANYLRSLALKPLAAKELRVFGLAGWLDESFSAAWHEVMADVWRERKEQRAKVGIIAVATVAVYGVAFVTIGRAAVRGQISLGELSVVTTSLFTLGGLAGMGNPDFELEYGTAALAAVPELEETVAALPRPAGTEAVADRPRHDIRFEGVSFHYPGSRKKVFDGLDLTIQAGRSLAIVGENGAGKTTLVKLLSRLYEPDSGRLLLDGTPLDDFHPVEWQQRIAAIFQDFVRYPLDARANVGFGAPAFMSDGEILVRAAERAGAAGIIESLDNGWDTVLSRMYTDGAELSGGQWQRVALARALFAVQGGARVLVLDEPTANLDVRAEADIYDRFLELTEGLTTILISHRFSTVRRADRIVVLDQGRVVEDGTHESLLARGGRYAEMFRLQAVRFVDSEEAAGA